MFCPSLYFSDLSVDNHWNFLFFSFLGFFRGFLRLNFSNFDASSLVLFPALYPVARPMIPARKKAGCQCNAASRFLAKENCPNAPVPRGYPVSPPPPLQSAWADVRDVITQIFRIYRSFSLSRNKKINQKPSSGKSQEFLMFKQKNVPAGSTPIRYILSYCR